MADNAVRADQTWRSNVVRQDHFNLCRATFAVTGAGIFPEIDNLIRGCEGYSKAPVSFQRLTTS